MADTHGPDVPEHSDKPDNAFERFVERCCGRWLVPDWRLVHKMRSLQIAIFWAAFAGLWVALPAFQSWLKPVPFAILCVFFSVTICIARLTKQKGFPDV